MYSKGLWVGFTFAQAVPLACSALTHPFCMALSSRPPQSGFPCFLSLTSGFPSFVLYNKAFCV